MKVDGNKTTTKNPHSSRKIHNSFSCNQKTIYPKLAVGHPLIKPPHELHHRTPGR
jgi:hypothetical protein